MERRAICRRHCATIRANKQYNPSFRQLLHVGFKVAAQMGERYIQALEKFEPIVAKNVTENTLRPASETNLHRHEVAHGHCPAVCRARPWHRKPMKAIRLEEPGRFEAIEIAEPAKPGAGEALVRVHRVGVCGTDISGYLGKMPFFSYPRIPGHELGVEVLAVGAGREERQARRSLLGRALHELRQLPRLPEGRQQLLREPQGAWSDDRRRSAASGSSSRLTSCIRLDQALLRSTGAGGNAGDRLPCGRSLRADEGGELPDHRCRADRSGQHRLCQAYRRKIIVLDMNRQRLEFCKQVMGVDETLVPGDQLEPDLRHVTDGNLPDVVIDATGSNVSMSNAFGYVAPTGRLVYVGITTKEVTFKHPIFHRPEGTLLCSRNALPRDFSRIIRLIETGQIDTQPWITHRTRSTEVPARLRIVHKARNGRH